MFRRSAGCPVISVMWSKSLSRCNTVSPASSAVATMIRSGIEGVRCWPRSASTVRTSANSSPERAGYPAPGYPLGRRGPSWAVYPRAAHHRAQVPRLALAPQPAAAGPHPQRSASRLDVPSSRSGAARCSIEPVARRSPAASRNLPPARCPGIPATSKPRSKPPQQRGTGHPPSLDRPAPPRPAPASPGPARRGPARPGRTAERQLLFPLRLTAYPGPRFQSGDSRDPH